MRNNANQPIFREGTRGPALRCGNGPEPCKGSAMMDMRRIENADQNIDVQQSDGHSSSARLRTISLVTATAPGPCVHTGMPNSSSLAGVAYGVNQIGRASC